MREKDKVGNSYCYFQKHISNNCFSATVSLFGERKYDPATGKLGWSEPWHAFWSLSPNDRRPGLHGNIIRQVNRNFKSLDAAKAYVRGRMDYLARKHFYSMDPEIPLEMRSYFLVHGVEIPGMRYEKG